MKKRSFFLSTGFSYRRYHSVFCTWCTWCLSNQGKLLFLPIIISCSTQPGLLENFGEKDGHNENLQEPTGFLDHQRVFVIQTKQGWGSVQKKLEPIDWFIRGIQWLRPMGRSNYRIIQKKGRRFLFGRNCDGKAARHTKGTCACYYWFRTWCGTFVWRCYYRLSAHKIEIGNRHADEIGTLPGICACNVSVMACLGGTYCVVGIDFQGPRESWQGFRIDRIRRCREHRQSPEGRSGHRGGTKGMLAPAMLAVD